MGTRLLVEVGSEADDSRAERLIQKAERSCLVSRSLETPVTVRADARVTV
jgi:organic hydroperoxide reductase OsmC/OhrA